MSDNIESIKQRIQADMKASMKAGNKQRLAVIRLMMADIKRREVDERIDLDDAQIIGVLDKMLKQRRESISQYGSAGRDDLVKAEQEEINVIKEFLPEAMSEQEIDRMIEAAIENLGAATLKDMGKVIASLKQPMQGRADMAEVSKRIKSRLSSSA